MVSPNLHGDAGSQFFEVGAAVVAVGRVVIAAFFVLVGAAESVDRDCSLEDPPHAASPTIIIRAAAPRRTRRFFFVKLMASTLPPAPDWHRPLLGRRFVDIVNKVKPLPLLEMMHGESGLLNTHFPR